MSTVYESPGVFWTAAAEERVGGTLRVSAAGKIELALVGALGEPHFGAVFTSELTAASSTPCTEGDRTSLW